MAEVSFLHFPDDDLFIDEISAIEDISFLSLCPHHQDHVTGSTPDFDHASPPRNGDVVSSPTDRKNQVSFVMDLFHQRVEESNLIVSHDLVSNGVSDASFGVIERNCDMTLHSFDLDSGLELGLGLGFVDEPNHARRYFRGVNIEEEDMSFGGFVLSDCGDDFFVAGRENCNNGGSSSRGGGAGGAVRVSWIESDSDGEDEGIENEFGIHVHSDDDDDDVDDLEDFGVSNVNIDGDDDDDELGVPICWDSCQLEEVENVEVNHDFEWEEVDDRVDEREVLSLLVDPEGEDEEGSISVLNLSLPEEDVGRERERESGNSEWEVLLNVNHLERNPEMESEEAGHYFGDHDDYIYTAEYEMMFGQFADGDNAYLCRPPAAKTVVEKLPSVVTTEEDVVDEKAVCAVCKEQIEVRQEGKQLPCTHRYHGECIIPWLEIRNTCPVCRFELPTDDPDYEQRRIRRAARLP